MLAGANNQSYIKACFLKRKSFLVDGVKSHKMSEECIMHIMKLHCIPILVEHEYRDMENLQGVSKKDWCRL